MRFIPANCLRVGMQVAKTLYGKHNESLLVRGVVLTESSIDCIKRLKYPGVYIEDDISRDLEVHHVISDKLRMETMNNVKKVFVQAEFGGRQLKEDDIRNNVESIIDELLENSNMVINIIDLKCFDNYTYSHSVNVAVLSLIIGIKLGLNRDELMELGIGALMHDIGKVFIDKYIINKPDKLTEYEFDVMKTHSKRGYDYLKANFSFPAQSHKAVLDHHERYNGSGYPNGRKYEEISLFGRLIAISDVYDALSSERPYRKALLPSEAVEYIMSGAGNLFDPQIVEVFIHKIAPYPTGSMVKLSNGFIAIVIENFESFCLRPIVRVIKNEDDEDVVPFEISLKDDFNYLNVTIVGIAEE